MVSLTQHQLKNIAEELQTGLKCFVHRQTGERVSYPDQLLFSDADDEIWQEQRDKIETNPDAYVAISPMTGRAEFRVMEQFSDQVFSKSLQNRLRRALTGPKPFRNFKDEVDNAGEYREDWFRFRDEQTVQWVKEQLEADNS